MMSATAEAARFGETDAIIICVPTPLTEAREPDLSYIVKTGEAIAGIYGRVSSLSWKARLIRARPTNFYSQFSNSWD